MAVNKNGVSVRFVVTEGVVADCNKAEELVENTGARGLISDKGYDSNKLVKFAENLGMKFIIPSQKNRKHRRDYDKDIYKIRHLIENAFLYIKRWRSIATRFL